MLLKLLFSEKLSLREIYLECFLLTVAINTFVRILPLLVLVPRISLDSKLILSCGDVIILCRSLIMVQDKIVT